MILKSPLLSINLSEGVQYKASGAEGCYGDVSLAMVGLQVWNIYSDPWHLCCMFLFPVRAQAAVGVLSLRTERSFRYEKITV